MFTARSGQPVGEQSDEALVAGLDPRGSNRRALEAARLDGRAVEDRANFAHRRRDLLLRLCREDRKGVLVCGIIAVGGERFEELLAEALGRLEVAHPALVAE